MYAFIVIMCILHDTLWFRNTYFARNYYINESSRLLNAIDLFTMHCLYDKIEFHIVLNNENYLSFWTILTKDNCWLKYYTNNQCKNYFIIHTD